MVSSVKDIRAKRFSALRAAVFTAALVLYFRKHLLYSNTMLSINWLHKAIDKTASIKIKYNRLH